MNGLINIKQIAMKEFWKSKGIEDSSSLTLDERRLFVDEMRAFIDGYMNCFMNISDEINNHEN